ncbi:MAG: hypothetical protein SPJ23_03770, partial [Eubacteriales bacterium]|nr:hypothetical protein [Eubacteriales bacterium]
MGMAVNFHHFASSLSSHRTAERKTQSQIGITLKPYAARRKFDCNYTAIVLFCQVLIDNFQSRLLIILPDISFRSNPNRVTKKHLQDYKKLQSQKTEKISRNLRFSCFFVVASFSDHTMPGIRLWRRFARPAPGER